MKIYTYCRHCKQKRGSDNDKRCFKIFGMCGWCVGDWHWTTGEEPPHDPAMKQKYLVNMEPLEK